MRRVTSLVLTVALVVGGCAAPAPGDGWRTGTILQIGLPSTLTRPVDADCRRLFSVDVLAQQPFAVVQYFSGKVVHLRTVPVPEGSSANVGDAVLVNLGRCRAFAAR